MNEWLKIYFILKIMPLAIYVYLCYFLHLTKWL